MSLASRIRTLEKRTITRQVIFLGWKNCEWKYSEGLIRAANETKADFFKRLVNSKNKNYFWCK